MTIINKFFVLFIIYLLVVNVCVLGIETPTIFNLENPSNVFVHQGDNFSYVKDGNHIALYGYDESRPESNKWYLIDKQEEIEGLTPYRSFSGKYFKQSVDTEGFYRISTLNKVDGIYRTVLSDIKTKEDINNIIVDPSNPSRILAFQTRHLSKHKWHFLDFSFENKVALLKDMINSQLGEYSQYSWDFYEISAHIHSDSSCLLDIGLIEFENYIITNGIDKFFSHHNPNGITSEELISSLQSLKLEAFPKHEAYSIPDPTNYMVDFALFRAPSCSHSPTQTIMIIDGGPQGFINYKKQADKILFFQKYGYHVVIPQGLFREGYQASHLTKSKGEFGELDIEQLRSILRYLKTQNISSDVYVMGSSYGGYCAARLGSNPDLVKAVFIKNPFLDITSDPFDADTRKFLLVKIGESEDTNKERKQQLSHVHEAPIPQVPVMMVAVQNDDRCTIDKARRYVERLNKNKVPLLYLEDNDGKGHSTPFPYYQLILDFYEGKFKDINSYKMPKNYEAKEDCIGKKTKKGS